MQIDFRGATRMAVDGRRVGLEVTEMFDKHCHMKRWGGGGWDERKLVYLGQNIS